MDKNVRKLKRTSQVISVLTKYGFGEILSQSGLPKFRSGKEESLTLSFYERIRLALEELGPAFVKLGQMFSDREDLFPERLVFELKKLQDNVPPENINVREKIEIELGVESDKVFQQLDEKPLAAASISQVYSGVLKTGERVIVKIKRTKIEEIIETDLMIMRDLAKILELNSERIRKLNLLEIVEAFEKSIRNELSFVNEIQNIDRFSYNFRKEETIKIPKVYREFSSNDLVCMEFIEGTKISEITKLKEKGIIPKDIAKLGFNLYLEQIIEHGFFHADPHPGNLFVTDDKRIAFIDFGTMGSLLPSDKEHLERFAESVVHKNPKKMIQVIKDLSISYQVKNEKLLERQIYEIFEMVEATPLEELKLSMIIEKMKNIFQENAIRFPGYIYLLMRGLILIEGIGRKLDPQLNIMEMLQPYTMKVIKKRLSPEFLWKKSTQLIQDSAYNLQHLPEDIQLIVQKIKNDELTVQSKWEDGKKFQTMVRSSLDKLVLAILIASLWVSAALFALPENSYKLNGFPILSVCLLILSVFVLGKLIWKTYRN